jgi:DNA-binding XRE family transcriptional regulator
MRTSVAVQTRWDTLDYQTITAARHEAGSLVVAFGDGSQVAVEPDALGWPELRSADWSALLVDPLEIQVPAPDGAVEISWLVIRLLTDPEFRAHWDDVATRENRKVGERVRQLRETRKLSQADLAARSGLTLADLQAVEQGTTTAGFHTLERGLSPMGYALDDLIGDAS